MSVTAKSNIFALFEIAIPLYLTFKKNTLFQALICITLHYLTLNHTFAPSHFRPFAPSFIPLLFFHSKIIPIDRDNI